MNACAPVAELVAVALAAEPVGLLEGDRRAARQVQLVEIVRVVTVEAPAVLRVVLQHDLLVGVAHPPPSRVDRKVLLDVAIRARKGAFGEGRRRNLEHDVLDLRDAVGPDGGEE
jgi:hypothetical protein